MEVLQLARVINQAAKAASDTGQKIKYVNNFIDKTVSEFNGLEDKYKLQLLRALGVGKDFFTCNKCGDVYSRGTFYSSTAPTYKSGVTSICKSCAEDIAMPTIDGEKKLPTKETVDLACRALNKPMLDAVWDASLLEAANTTSGRTKNNVWTSYIKNISMMNYYTLTYQDSDGYTGGAYSMATLATDELPKDQEVIKQFEKNKDDTLRLLGYLPFEREKLSDQPFLYAQLIGFLDSSEEGNDDMMRTSSTISIVRGFLQLSQIDDAIAQLVQDSGDLKNIERNINAIKNYQSMKANIVQSITKLAEQSCISLKNSKNAKKGENTWTGKIKKIKEINLREGEVNGFDIWTCKGMQQVMEMSDASIMKQLRLDDSEWSDMVADQRVMIRTLQEQKNNYEEISRILLRENIDLRDFLKENELLDTSRLVNLDDLYACFTSDEEVENNGDSRDGKNESESSTDDSEN